MQIPQVKPDHPISLSLTASDVEKIMKALFLLPFGEVYEVVNKVNDQSAEQVGINK